MILACFKFLNIFLYSFPLKIFSQVFYKKLVGGVGGENPDIKDEF